MSSGIKPMWQVTGDGGNFNTYLSRMQELTVVDEVGHDSDKFSITLEDDDPEHALPAKDAEISVSLWWEGESPVEKGIFKYDSCNVKGPERTLTLNFTAADMKGSLKARRSESYDNMSLQEIGQKVAGRNGLSFKAVGDIGSEKLKNVHQTAESDMAFMLRLATERDLFAKPSFGQLILGKPGTGAGGGKSLHISQVTEWSAELQARAGATKVKARVEDLAKGEVRYVESEGGSSSGGAEDVTRELLKGFRDDDSAKAAANASLEEQNRGTGTITILMPGDPNWFAEDHVTISGFSIKVDGEWRITSVSDTVGHESWMTTLQGERKADVMSSGSSGGDSGGEVVTFPVDGGGQTPGSK